MSNHPFNLPSSSLISHSHITEMSYNTGQLLITNLQGEPPVGDTTVQESIASLQCLPLPFTPRPTIHTLRRSGLLLSLLSLQYLKKLYLHNFILALASISSFLSVSCINHICFFSAYLQKSAAWQNKEEGR